MIKCWKISGRVQHVGFRRWLVKNVMYIGGISGYVYNDANGDVLVCAETDIEKMEQLLSLLYKGPMFARVDSVVAVPELEKIFPPPENGVFKVLTN